MRGTAFVECNGKTVSLFGCHAKIDILGRSPWQLSPVYQPDGQSSAEKARELVEAALQYTPQQFDWTHLKMDGTPFEAEVSLSAFEDRGERLLLAIVRDVTAQRRAMREIAVREATLQSVFKAAPAGIGVTVDRVIMQANDRICEMTLYRQDEIIGRNARFLYPSDEEYERVGLEKYQQIEKQGWGTVETHWQRKDGTILDILLSSAPIDPDNWKVGITFTATDITERKRNEAILRSLLEATSRATGRQFFRSLVRDVARGLGFKYAHVAVLVGPEQNRVKTLAFWDGEAIGKNFEYDLSNAPGGDVIRQSACIHYNQVSTRFPDYRLPGAQTVESYLGMPLRGRSGETMGLLVVADDKPLAAEAARFAESLLAVFAARATTEFERIRADDQLKQANEELKAEQQALKEKNIALSEILSHMERDREKYRHELCESISRLFEPVMTKLRDNAGRLSDKEVAILDSAMKSMVGKDLDQFRDNFARLSPREMEICEMIRQGLGSKEIAESLSVSLTTVHKHREMIRKKLRIQNRDINLSAYLRYKS